MRHPPVLLRPAATASAPHSAASEDTAAAAVHYRAGSPTAVVSNGGPLQHSTFSSCGGGGGGTGSGGVAFSSATTTTTTAANNASNAYANGGGCGSAGPTSAFSGSAPSLIGPLLPSARRYVAVRLLTGETLQFDVEVCIRKRSLDVGPCHLRAILAFHRSPRLHAKPLRHDWFSLRVSFRFVFLCCCVCVREIYVFKDPYFTDAIHE